MSSAYFERLARCMILLACMFATACEANDALDDDIELRDAQQLSACSEACSTIGLLADGYRITWIDGDQLLGDDELLIAVGNDASVTLCLDFVDFGGRARISAKDGSKQELGGDDDEASCVVMLRPVLTDSTGQVVFGDLVLQIETLEAEPVAGEELDRHLAPVKSSGKITVISSCPKLGVTYD